MPSSSRISPSVRAHRRAGCRCRSSSSIGVAVAHRLAQGAEGGDFPRHAWELPATVYGGFRADCDSEHCRQSK